MFTRLVCALLTSCLLTLGFAIPAHAQHPPLNVTNWGVGDNAFPWLYAWGYVDQVQLAFTHRPIRGCITTRSSMGTRQIHPINMA